MTELQKRLEEILKSPHQNSFGATVMTIPSLKLLEQLTQAFIDDGWKDPIFIAADISRGRTGEMTGQEWYDRFMKEYPAWTGFISKDYNNGYADSRMKALEAAKKAAGLPELREQS